MTAVTFRAAPDVTDIIVRTPRGHLATQLVHLAGGIPGRIWLFQHRDPAQSEYYIEAFNLDTVSWSRLHVIDPGVVGDILPSDQAARLQEIAEQLFATANAVLTAAGAETIES